MVYLVGGEQAAFARAKPVLKCLGGAVNQAGASGTGAGLKLIVISLFAVQVATIAELLELAKASGLDPLRALEILGTTHVASPAAKAATASMLAGAYAPMFPIELVEKDLTYAGDLARTYSARALMTTPRVWLWAKPRAEGSRQKTLRLSPSYTRHEIVVRFNVSR